MRKVVVILASVLLLVMVPMTALAGGTGGLLNDPDGIGSAGGGPASSAGTFRACCQVAADRYLASVAQPPSITARLDAIAAVRASVRTGVVDRLLRAFMP